MSERPDVFEEQFTAGGFGWVVIYLAGIEVDELTELVFEAWRLSAPDDLIIDVPDRARPGAPLSSGPTPWTYRRPQGVSKPVNAP